MIKNISIGKYIPGDSFLHKLDTRTKILISMTMTITAFSTKDLNLLLILSLIGLLMVKLSGIMISKFIRSNFVILLFSLFTILTSLIFEVCHSFSTSGAISISRKSLDISTGIFLRLISIILATSSVMYTTSPNEISSSVEKMLIPLKFFGISPRDIALTLTITLKFIPTIFEEANKILNAQRARGANFGSKNIIKNIKAISSVFIPLFVSSIRRADDLAVALESRCYSSFGNHTNFKDSKFKKQDYIAFLILGLFILGVILCKILLKI